MCWKLDTRLVPGVLEELEGGALVKDVYFFSLVLLPALCLSADEI